MYRPTIYALVNQSTLRLILSAASCEQRNHAQGRHESFFNEVSEQQQPLAEAGLPINRMLNGDCIEVMHQLPAGGIDFSRVAAAHC